jgi:acyl-CoA thioester hydrolase
MTMVAEPWPEAVEISGLADGQPLPLLEVEVTAATVNALGHMRAAAYVDRFDDAFMVLFPRSGLTDERLLHGRTSPFLMDLHATYLAEVRAGEAVAIVGQLLEFDERRVRVILSMSKPEAGGAPRLVATCELAILNMDLDSRRPTPWSPAQAAILARLLAAHRSLPTPPQAGRAIRPLA